MRIVDINSLDVVQELGKGGQGAVHLVRAARQAGPAEEYAYKEYRRNGLPIDYASLGGLTEFTERLEPAEQVLLHGRLAWPLAVVGDKQRGQTGFLMRLVPSEFFFTHHRSTGPAQAIAEFQHLLNGPAFATRLGFHYSATDLYELLAKTAETLDFLHRRGVTVGDISPKNICFRLRPTPENFFLDCDAMALDGRSVSPQLETPGWDVPKLPSGVRAPLGTRESDAYKFGLLVLRTLAGDQEARNSTALPPHTPVQVRIAVEQALSAAPGSRPAMGQWTAVLRGAAQDPQLAQASQPAPVPPAEQQSPAHPHHSAPPHHPAQPPQSLAQYQAGPPKSIPATFRTVSIFILSVAILLAIAYALGEAIS